MTCFWDGILRALQKDAKQRIGNCNHTNFIHYLKKNNKKTNDVKWNGYTLSNQELTEHYNAVSQYNIGKIRNGHLCSTCDSFLLLICDIFNVNIQHRYMNTTIRYNKKDARRTIHFASNRGHFWHSRN